MDGCGEVKPRWMDFAGPFGVMAMGVVFLVLGVIEYGRYRFWW